MGLYKFHPEPSGRMGLLWTLGLISDAVVLEFGAMGHMLYAEKWLKQTGLRNRGKLYATHIDEKDISLGITKRLEEAVDEIVEKDSPKAIFLLPSSIPEIIGVDLDSLREVMQQKYRNISIITLKKGGFKDKYFQGIEEALYKVTEIIPRQEKPKKILTYNIIGSCADLNKFQADERELKRILKGALGMECLCCLPSDSSISKIEKMCCAHINLVIRREGIKAAEELERNFGTPFIYGRPYGYAGTGKWLEDIGQRLNIQVNQAFINEEIWEGRYVYDYCRQMVKFKENKSIISLGGNIDVVKGIMEFACGELGMKRGLFWCNNKEYETEQIPYYNEKMWMENINEDFQGILMSGKEVLEKACRDKTYTIDRGLESWNFNWYTPPFTGFRGAMNLCSLWLEYILED
ncbi:MAG: oxidoreductase/nitrogenase component 1 [Eubacterium sp.]|nr:oxidoreductase/nitrogenase component 1 [Eubacterium sp.]